MLLAYPNLQMSRERLVLLVFIYILYNEQYLCIILYKCLCSLKVRVKNIQVKLLEVFLIFEHFIGAISDLSTTSGAVCEHAAIAYSEPQPLF